MATSRVCRFDHAFDVGELDPPVARLHHSQVEPLAAAAPGRTSEPSKWSVGHDVAAAVGDPQSLHHKILAGAGVGDEADLRQVWR